MREKLYKLLVIGFRSVQYGLVVIGIFSIRLWFEREQLHREAKEQKFLAQDSQKAYSDLKLENEILVRTIQQCRQNLRNEDKEKQ